ncbi:5-methyltetrahydropteroyltriglutamate--homocysteine S-methyltransferase [uncultured Clostridium sp.]|uniref:5-methyltetrahydropteroyltriglutamate-- homocysteine S-methyltransferase n=1 Tax=uncultured Clostridium sp. TaxID=59620 RepID=UPI0025F8391D|nr:5-methyltetrahydropteroyltriglutamate--homocysteine S-methyltransferase [uncultured Clostridium sp.]
MYSKAIIGYPRVGKLRELKFSTERYFRGEESKEQLETVAKSIREEQWILQKNKGIDFIPSNDFSFYDNMLDTIILLGAIPKEYKGLNLDILDTYFAMARGYQGEKGDVKALPMKKWFNTNYHYIVPMIEDDMDFSCNVDNLVKYYKEALALNIVTTPSIIGPFTFLKLCRFNGKKGIDDVCYDILNVYVEALAKLESLGVEIVQVQEPYLVMDLTEEDKKLFTNLYTKLFTDIKSVKIVLQSYFGDIRDIYEEVCKLGFYGIGIDFVEGKQSLSLIKEKGFPKEKLLLAGVVNGKNIWKNDYSKTIELVKELENYTDKIVLNTSCSLLHVPYTLDNEVNLEEDKKKHFAFAEEKLSELEELSKILSGEGENLLEANKGLFSEKRVEEENQHIVLEEEDFNRKPVRKERKKIQKEFFKLPILPTTTIGSFPQTKDVKVTRKKYKQGEITYSEYDKAIKNYIKDVIKLQEDLGLDVLVHGEYERNDMVEYFGENLNGYLFTEKAWVQSYGTRCVKPPIIWGDVTRIKPITVEYSKYAQSLTKKPVKGMLTGPVTILNWSFPREDISLKEMAFQIGCTIRDEVLDLEKAGIKIIQIDEAALKEKLPLRKADWYTEYLDWAIKAFRLVHSRVEATTQIHTHMCYSEFKDIVKDIDNMDADVISFESSKSDLDIVGYLKEVNFETEVGPGVYDIHSPRVPSKEEIVSLIKKLLDYIDKENLWINPDCGLKTRGEKETIASLKNMVEAAKEIRKLI